MFALLSFFIFFLISVLQLTIIPRLALFGAIPNLVLVLIILWSVLFGFKKSFWLALVGGFFLDLFSGPYFGIFIVIFLVIAFLADLATNRIFGDNLLFSVLSLCSLFSALFVLLFDYLAFKSLFSNYKLIIILVLTIILNFFLALIFFPLISKFKDKIITYEKKARLPY
jgi:rod shape-determining protein MreD